MRTISNVVLRTLSTPTRQTPTCVAPSCLKQLRAINAFSIIIRHPTCFCFFFLNDPATTEISPLPLPAPLPIFPPRRIQRCARHGSPDRRGYCLRQILICLAGEDPGPGAVAGRVARRSKNAREHCSSPGPRSEEHTSELQSQSNLVCRLLLEKKK